MWLVFVQDKQKQPDSCSQSGSQSGSLSRVRHSNSEKSADHFLKRASNRARIPGKPPAKVYSGVQKHHTGRQNLKQQVAIW